MQFINVKRQYVQNEISYMFLIFKSRNTFAYSIFAVLPVECAKKKHLQMLIMLVKRTIVFFRSLYVEIEWSQYTG